LALAAAANWETLTGLSAQAFPASELLLFPELVLDKNSSTQLVLISRSGTTSEVLRAAELLQTRDIPFLGVTCTPGGALQKLAAATLVPCAADEKSIVMTLSFTSMLLTLQYLAARMAGNEQFLHSLLDMAKRFEAVLDEASAALKTFVSDHEFSDYVWLGQGLCYGLACEGALKVSEMSCSFAQSYHTLEFRHGPKSIVRPDTLIMFQLSERGFDAERAVLEEVKELGGTTLVVTNEADPRTQCAADLLVELGFASPECAGLAARIVPAQLLGLYSGLQKGFDPDSPRNLSRVVTLA